MIFLQLVVFKMYGREGRAGIQAGSNLPLEYQSVLISPCPPKIAAALEKGKKINFKMKDSC